MGPNCEHNCPSNRKAEEIYPGEEGNAPTEAGCSAAGFEDE